MARLTVEDCLKTVGNRYELVLLAIKRARYLSMGGSLEIDSKGDKPTVTALREIAAAKVTPDNIDSMTRSASFSESDAHTERNIEAMLPSDARTMQEEEVLGEGLTPIPGDYDEDVADHAALAGEHAADHAADAGDAGDEAEGFPPGGNEDQEIL